MSNCAENRPEHMTHAELVAEVRTLRNVGVSQAERLEAMDRWADRIVELAGFVLETPSYFAPRNKLFHALRERPRTPTASVGVSSDDPRVGLHADCHPNRGWALVVDGRGYPMPKESAEALEKILRLPQPDEEPCPSEAPLTYGEWSKVFPPPAPRTNEASIQYPQPTPETWNHEKDWNVANGADGDGSYVDGFWACGPTRRTLEEAIKDIPRPRPETATPEEVMRIARKVQKEERESVAAGLYKRALRYEKNGGRDYIHAGYELRQAAISIEKGEAEWAPETGGTE